MRVLILFIILSLLPITAKSAWEVTAPYTATYSAVAPMTAPYANPTDICSIGGVSSATLRVFHVRVYGWQTTAGVNAFYLVKRSSYSVGTNNSLTAVQHDSLTPAAGANVQRFTVSPTLGTQVGIVRGADVFMGTIAALSNSFFDFDLGPNSGSQPVILHNNEMLSLNFRGLSLPAGADIGCEFQWNEQ